MGKTDPRVDQYIAKSADFAKPILTHLRKVVHTACPDVEETMKWSFPHFDYKGMMCSMAAFKGHCAFGFWKSTLVLDGPADDDAMGHFGRITSVRDLPADRALAAYVKKAAKLNAEGIKVAKNPAARKTFEALSPSQTREYLEWVTEAKTDATRQKRMKTAVDWLSEGKSRNWKYEPK